LFLFHDNRLFFLKGSQVGDLFLPVKEALIFAIGFKPPYPDPHFLIHLCSASEDHKVSFQAALLLLFSRLPAVFFSSSPRMSIVCLAIAIFFCFYCDRVGKLSKMKESRRTEREYK